MELKYCQFVTRKRSLSQDARHNVSTQSDIEYSVSPIVCI